MSTELKYVRHSTFGFILWPAGTDLWHAHVGRMVERVGGKVVSAGFTDLSDGTVFCYGKSEFLGMSSLPEDTALLAAQLGLKVAGTP
jgi:hypothetical protein